MCLARYIDEQTLGELKTGRIESPNAPAQNQSQVCISYPNGALTKVGDPVNVTLVVRYQWLNYITRQLSIASTDITGSATMRLESKPFSGVSLTDPACYPDAPAGT
jgi:hypothetical protein